LVRLWAIVFILGIFVGSALLPYSWIEGSNLCYLKSLFGFDCPGCGLTRAFSYLFKGEFRQSIQMNAMAPVLVLWFGIYLFQHLYTLIQKNRPIWFTPQGNQIIGRLFIILFAGQWIWKNLRYFWLD